MLNKSNEKVYNFSAGPSILPEAVLKRAQGEFVNYGGTGISVMEMSHRSTDYIAIFDSVKTKLRAAMNIPETHEILFMHGGATGQFSVIPLNLMAGGHADYAITGNFAKIAAEEAKKYGKVNIIYDTADKNHTYIPKQEDLKFTDGAAYFHYCANNTIYGTKWGYVPNAGEIPVVSDMSSCILSERVDVSKFAIIYAGVQKNMAPAGFVAVIIDKQLKIEPHPLTPRIFDYNLEIKNDSMLNTPPAYNIYILGLVLDWIESIGGLDAIADINIQKAKLLYDFLDNSAFYRTPAVHEARSIMNVTYFTPSPELDSAFVKEAAANGLINLKGHRLVGGIRASIYNAMPVEGIQRLIRVMEKFELEHK
jgi:phosphoserine aminotransferase